MPRALRVLQFGTTGQLGRELLRFAAGSNASVRALSSAEADFTRPEEVARAVAQSSGIDVVVNAAAYTAVDKAEVDEQVARRVNGDAVGALAEACAKQGLPLIHISTDYVFDGEKLEPYSESDATNPISAYGRSKLAGEQAICASGVRHVILRTSWVYSAFGNNFMKTILRLGAERDELRVIDDQYGAPTAASDLAATIYCVAHGVANAPTSAMFGIYHYTGGGATTWYGFAAAIVANAREQAGTRARIIPIPTDQYPLPARRPKNSRLDCAKISHTFGVSQVPWQVALQEVLGDLERERSDT